ncbi:chromosome segregation and condensation protein, ScpB [Thermovirga lienii DSM 17291]|uniref:Chromosome segregation and condensation protein, ScpB n=1 Tax=Thermovirga lienii (strain ATCC BAA-1197 / DSM 17291 / Cas60314) TaxID=580340 RepID=G7V580_THELD|nr:SMC-Scp complex subunit ScpB [Thermovirga lienii]AER66863.1 chromosome segregation and condensation protein, ScpB [Thermovirga lienii DSM 17291]MDN5318117.1 segregation and condensation protein [Thermovirga sp.]MDN5367328.1 segregation and condensation protein [Thermovirga sp.]HCD71936.1 SMC-Scp complex subunit ScpB [Thermovirga lienii]
MLSIVAQSIEVLLFVSFEPLSEEKLAEVIGVSQKSIKESILELADHYEKFHGLRLRKVSGGWKIFTAPNLSEVVEALSNKETHSRLKLSKAAMETLAVVAFSQPVTRAEIEEIRGVRCDKVLETLLSNGLIRVAGRKKGTGTPLLYRTTDKFLEIFGLSAISDLPTLDEIQEMYSSEDNEGQNEGTEKHGHGSQ